MTDHGHAPPPHRNPHSHMWIMAIVGVAVGAGMMIFLPRLKIASTSILLFAGFFRDQMARRHNVRWYDQVGQSMYEKASQYSRDMKKREFFDRMSTSFPAWTMICNNMSRACRDNRLLLRFN